MKDNDFSVNAAQITASAVVEKAKALLAQVLEGEISIGAFQDELRALLDAPRQAED